MLTAERLLNIRAVCARTSLSTITIRRMVKRGELSAALFGGRFLFAESEVDAWIAARLASRVKREAAQQQC